ncbi:MAG: tetrahydrofolate dehydrogenase/cyclohydrolase catalytic domain-containing protein [Bacteroidales bacterium]|nr:tetrahydrofolate dehydrogenase/cyclohydrolase catalytic domain-containing protein [Bacteroidales bacterium]
MEIISGKDLAASIKQDVAKQIAEYANIYGRTPNLTVILVGDDPASVSYVTGKGKACAEVGIKNNTITLPANSTEEDVIALIQKLNNDKTVDGILVQLPLPKQISEQRVIDTIAKEKDVDGFHPYNVAALWEKRPCILPCTPKGVVKLLKSKSIDITGKRVVVMGRSNIVGLPAAKLMLDENATVTIVHSRTQNIAQVCAEADILIVGIGKPKFVKPEMIKQGAAVIDVGVNRDPETGKLCGDVDFDACADKCSYITKVPGGVGPMTIACLMENTLECFLHNVKQ